MRNTPAGPPKLRLDTSTQPDRPKSHLRRLFSLAKRQLARPSLLSTTSDSDIESSADILLDPAVVGTSRDAVRVFGTLSRRSQKGSVSVAHADSKTEVDGAPDDDEEPVTKVVVDGDFGIVAVDDDDGASGSMGHSIPSAHARNAARGSVANNNSYSKSSAGMVDRLALPSWLPSLWEGFLYFWNSSFADRSKERSFQKEQYYAQRKLGIGAALFYILLWALFVGLSPLPLRLYDYVAYLGVMGFFTLPVFPLILLNFPYRHPRTWQIWLMLATWCLPILGIVDFYLCGFFKPNTKCANSSDFVIFAAAIGQSTLAVLCLGQKRSWVVLGFSAFFITTGALFFGPSAPDALYRDVIYFIIFHAFLIGVNFITERSARQLFELRDQLKLQYKATQRAQVMEKKASDLTKRFVSYIFHEVRVPLNTALLSVQNLEGENLFDCFSEDQRDMVHGLTGSLSMMEKVLNDVLSFNRMESGTFTQAKAPFSFHRSMQLVTLSHTPPAHMRGISLEADLDPKIDSLGLCFIGDEMRLRQITSNLVSNSIKFTQQGGVKIVTKLLYVNTTGDLRPAIPVQPEIPIQTPTLPAHESSRYAEREGTTHVEMGDVTAEGKRHHPDASEHGMLRGHTAVIRVEVHDTGVGLRKRDLQDDRLFSPYVQTEIGRRQGGKGTGLGLALVRQIVQLSCGRLGVDSKVGKGTVIWFEIPYSLGDSQPCLYPQTPLEISSAGSGSGDSSGGTAGSTAVSTSLSQADTLTNGGESSKFPTLRLPKSDEEEGEGIQMETYTAEQILISGPPFDNDGRLTPASFRRMNSRNSKKSRSSSMREQERPSLREQRSRSDGSRRPPSRGGAPLPLPSPNEHDERAKTPPPPPSAAPLAPPTAAPPTSPSGPVEGLNVLVVDDDKLTRMMMARMLKRLGHTVDTAEDGQQALDKITDAFNSSPGVPPVNVVFLDNQMPRMTGVEVSSHVRALGSDLFIVGCTGNALRQDQEEYISAGADRILTKPIKQAAVEDSIREARKRLAGDTKAKEVVKQAE